MKMQHHAIGPYLLKQLVATRLLGRFFEGDYELLKLEPSWVKKHERLLQITELQFYKWVFIFKEPVLITSNEQTSNDLFWKLTSKY